MIRPSTDWEGRVQTLARAFTYPPTPDLSRSASPWPAAGSSPRWAWATVIMLALLAGLMAVPPVRAAVVEFLRLGAVRIFLAEPTPTADEGRSIATPI